MLGKRRDFMLEIKTEDFLQQNRFGLWLSGRSTENVLHYGGYGISVVIGATATPLIGGVVAGVIFGLHTYYKEFGKDRGLRHTKITTPLRGYVQCL